MIDTEPGDVCGGRTGIGGVQDVQQPVLIAQADRTCSARGEYSRHGESASVDVDYGDLVTARIHGEQPPAVAGANQRALRSVGKRRQAALATDVSHASLSQGAVGFASERSDRVRAEKVVVQDVDVPRGAAFVIFVGNRGSGAQAE